MGRIRIGEGEFGLEINRSQDVALDAVREPDDRIRFDERACMPFAPQFGLVWLGRPFNELSGSPIERLLLWIGKLALFLEVAQHPAHG